jgi:hypothetical protein
MKGSKLITFLLCITLCVFLLSACGKQAAEEPTVPPTEAAQTENPNGLEQGELPAIIIPQQTEPVTTPTEDSEPTEGTMPPAATEPSKGTEPTEPKPTEPPKETEPTEPEPTQPKPTEPEEPSETAPPETTEPPKLDENELPPIPVF